MIRDRTDQLAWLQVLQNILQDLAPGGEWLNEPVYLKWKANPYSLTMGEYRHLEHCLDTYRKQAEYQRFRKEANYV